MGERRGGGGGWASATMDLLRSEPMQLAQLIIPVESAHRTISYLGDLVLFQFKDVSTWNNLFLSFFLFFTFLQFLLSIFDSVKSIVIRYSMPRIWYSLDVCYCWRSWLQELHLFSFTIPAFLVLDIYLCLCAKLKWYHGRESLRFEKFIVHCSDWTFSWLIHDWTFLLWYFKL